VALMANEEDQERDDRPAAGEDIPGPVEPDEAEDRGVPDEAVRGPEEPHIHDQIDREGPDGSAFGETAVPMDTVGAPPAVPEAEQPATGDLSGRPEPAGGYGPARTDIPPHAERPEAPSGWDRAVDLEAAPGTVPDPAEVYVPPELRAEILEHMGKYPDRRSAVIPALHAAQAVHGWCSPRAIYQVAAVMQVTPAYLSSIATFYDMLNEEPVGRRHVYVCTGVACGPLRPQRVLDAIEESAETQGLEDTEIRSFECLGACDMAPMASVDGRYIGPLDPSDAPEIVRAIKAGEKPLPGRGLEDSDYRLPWGGRA
jgi:NADH-quinone oxidoreductase subunit E